MRSQLGAFLAFLAILMNALLPAEWEQAFANPSPFGGTFSICLAGGGTRQASGQPSGAPVSPACALHCRLCLMPAAAAAPLPEPGVTLLTLLSVVPVRYEEVRTGCVFSSVTTVFDARAPPA